MNSLPTPHDNQNHLQKVLTACKYHFQQSKYIRSRAQESNLQISSDNKFNAGLILLGRLGSKPKDAAQQGDSPADESLVGKSSEEILTRVFLETGLATFFHLVERDSSSKEVMLQTLSLSLRAVPPLSLRDLPTLPLNNLRRLNGFLVATLDNEMANSQRPSTAMVEQATDSLVQLVMALGYLDINHTFLKLIRNHPSLLQRRHIQCLRNISLMQQENKNYKLPKAKNRKVKTICFLPPLGSDDHVRKVWFRRMKSMLHSFGIFTKDTELLKAWACFDEHKEDNAHEILKQLFFPSQDTLFSTFPSPSSVRESLEKEFKFEIDLRARADAFLDKIELHLTRTHMVSKHVTGAAMMLPIMALARRLKFHDGTNQSLQPKFVPAHVIFGSEPLNSLTTLFHDLFIADSDSEIILDRDSSSKDNFDLEQEAKVLNFISWLSVLKVNLNWILVNHNNNGVSDTKDILAQIGQVKEILETIIFGKGDNLPTILPYSHDATVVSVAMEAFSCGVPVIYSDMNDVLHALQVLLQLGEDHSHSEMIKKTQILLMRRLSQCSDLWRLISGDAAENPEQANVSLEMHEIRQQAVDIYKVLVSDYFKDLRDVLEKPDLSTLQMRHTRHQRPVGEEELFWYWDLESSKNISLDETKMITKKTNGMSSGFIFGSVGFVSGVHCWYVRVDGTPLNVRIGYCRSSDPEQTSNSWHLEFPNTLSERSKQETCSVRIEDKDVVGVHLDLHSGKLDFYKNNVHIGSLQNVNGKVYPFVYFHYSANNVTISREYKSPTATSQLGCDYSEMLCRVIGTYVNMLFCACQEKPEMLMSPFNLSVLEQIYLKFHEFLDWFGKKVRQENVDSDVLKKIFWTLMNQRLLYADDCRITHFLPLLAKLLKTSAHLSLLPTTSSLFQSIVRCVYSLQELCSQFHDLMIYDGRHFNSFCLQGLRFSSPEFYYRISQPSVIYDSWSLHVILKRELSPSHCVASTVFSTSHFCLQLDERNCRGTLRIVETPTNKFYWCSDVSCKIGVWVCISISCQMGKMTLFINGVESGQIPISLPLNLLRIGTASDSSPDDFFCGSMREIHVFDKEKCGEEIFAMINNGMSSGVGHLFSIEFGNKVSDTLLQYGSMRLDISHAKKKTMKQRKPELVSMETHWLYEFTKEINALAVRHALLLFRGNHESEEEQLCTKWLNSLLFAQGEASRNDQMHAVAFEDVNTDDSFFQMLQPRIGVRLSPELDRLERSIIVVMLYHLQLLKTVEGSVTHKYPPHHVELCCRCASVAARNIRRHVMQTKDFYNQSAVNEENTDGWETFCSPVLKRCELLLNLPPMTSIDDEIRKLVYSQNDEHIGHKSITGIKDLPVELKLTIGAVFEFLKDDIDPETISVSLQKRKRKAKESENGLAALIDLLAVSKRSSLSSDSLCLLAYAPNSNVHYLSGICSSGLQAEQEVRAKFYSLITFLLNIGNDESLQPKIRIAAFTSLTTLYDHADLEFILSRLDDDLFNSSMPLQYSNSSRLSKTWSQSYEVMKCKNRYIGSLMIGVGLNNQKIGEACKAKIVSVVGSSLFSIFDRLNFNKGLCTTNSFQSWEGQVDAVCGSILPISMRLKSEFDETLRCKILTGTVSFNGKTHSVAGKSTRSNGSKELILLYAPNRSSHSKDSHDLRSKQILIFRGCMLNEFHMSGVVLTVISPQDGKLHRSYFDEDKNMSTDFEIKTFQNFQVFKVDRSPIPRDFLEKSLPFSSSLTVTPNCIVRCVSSEENMGIIFSNEPVSTTNNFVEMQIVTTSSDPCIAIGIASKPYGYKQMLGWSRESIAYYANDGNLVSQSNCDVNFGTCCGLGDVISCYVTFSVERELETVVWSKNGQYIGSKDISGLFQKPIYFAFATINTDDGIFISSGASSQLLEGLVEDERSIDLCKSDDIHTSLKTTGQVTVIEEGIKLITGTNGSSSARFCQSQNVLDTLIVSNTVCLVINEETYAEGFANFVLFWSACDPCNRTGCSDPFFQIEIQHKPHGSPREARNGFEFMINVKVANLKYSKLISFPFETIKEIWFSVEFHPGGNSFPIFVSDSEDLLGNIPFLLIPCEDVQISNEMHCGISIAGKECTAAPVDSKISASQIELDVKHWKVKTQKYASGCQVKDSNLDLCTSENQELKFLLSCVHSVCHDRYFRTQIRSKEWQACLWDMSTSESLDVEARFESIKCIMSSIVEDCDKDFVLQNLKRFIDFLTEISPENLIMKSATSVNAWTTNPSVVTWYQPPRNSGCEMTGYFSYGKNLPRSSLAFRQRVMQIFASLVIKPYVRDHFTAIVCEHFHRFQDFCYGGDCANMKWGSILCLGGILDTLLYKKTGVGLNDEFPHSETLVKEFFKTFRVILSCEVDDGSKESSISHLPGKKWLSNSNVRRMLISMLKARFMKCLWEFTKFRRFQELLCMEGDLMKLIVESARTATELPYISKRISRSQYSFDAQHKLSKTRIHENGKYCEIAKNVGQTILFDPLLFRGSGQHYVEIKILSDPSSYFLVGCAIPEYSLTKSLGDENGSWAWANDGDTKIEGKWNGQHYSKLPKFAEGDHVGMLLDMDSGVLKFTKNGELQKLEIDCSKQNFLRFAIGSTKAIRIEIPDKFMFDHISLSKQRPSWLTVETIVAKIENLSLQIGHGVPSAGHSELGEENKNKNENVERSAYQTDLRQFLTENSSMQNLFAVDEDIFANLASPSNDWFGENSSGSEPERNSSSSWFTTGDRETLLLSCESFLECTYARLTVLELLRSRMPSCSNLMSIRQIVQLLSYFFPPGHCRARSIMSSGIYVEITKALDEALRGWFSLSTADNDEGFAQDLSVLVDYCIQVLENMVELQLLKKKGIHTFICPVKGRILPSTVSWHLPPKVRIQDYIPENEVEAQSHHSSSLAIWLSSHIAEICSMRNPAMEMDRFVETLLQAICTQQAGSMQTSLIQSLQGILRSSKIGPTINWSQQCQALIRELHYLAIERLESELGTSRMIPGVCQDNKDRRRSPELKALVGLLVWIDLSRGKCEGVSPWRSALVYKKSSERKASKKKEELSHQLVEMGFSMDDINTALVATDNSELETLESDKGQALIGFLSKMNLGKFTTSSDEDTVDVELCPVLRVLSLNDFSKHTYRQVQGLGKSKYGTALAMLDSYGCLAEALESFRRESDPPTWLKNCSMRMGADRHQFLTWNDSEIPKGVRVSENCTLLGLEAPFEGEWLGSTGNFPFDDYFNRITFRIEVGTESGAKICIGVTNISNHHQDPLYSANWSVGLQSNPESGNCKIFSLDSERNLLLSPIDTVCPAFKNGTFVCLSVDLNRVLYIHVKEGKEPDKQVDLVARIELPHEGFFVPFAALGDDTISCEILSQDSFKRQKESGSKSSRFHESYLFSRQVVCPFRNSCSKKYFDWDLGFDSKRWNVCMDTLLVQYVADRANPKSKKEITPKNLFDDHESLEESVSSSYTLLARFPSELPPTIPSSPGMDLSSEYGVQRESDYAYEMDQNSLENCSRASVRSRYCLLKAFNKILKNSISLIDLTKIDCQDNIAHYLAYSKGRIFPSVKEAFMKSVIHQTKDSRSVPSISLNRGICTADKRKRELTVFWQVFKAVESKKATLRSVEKRGSGNQAWITTFEGEGGSDHGGLFRESVREICAELQSMNGSLKLFVPCPNQRMCIGENQDKWIPNVFSTSTLHLKMFRFVGALMGMAIRTNSLLELDLSSLVWKRLVGELGNLSDVFRMDEAFRAHYQDLSNCTSEAEWTGKGLTWTYRSSVGRHVPMVPGGGDLEVFWQSKDKYLAELVRLRLSEFELQVNALKEGLHTVVPPVVFALFTWRELEARVCGTSEISVEALRNITDHNLCDKDKNPVAVMFWKVLEKMSNSDRADLLAFAWGRRRLPPNNSNLRLKIELLSGRGDESLPEAHTCFFAIDLPKYSCEEVMHSKLLYAIRNCSAIDNDFAVQSEILFDAESELLSLSDGIELQDGANDSQGLYEEVQEKDFAARKSSQLDIPLDGGHEISICASDHVESDFLRHKQAYKFMDMAEAKIGSKLAGQAAHGRHPAAGAADQEDADEVDRMWNDNDSFNLDESTSDSDSSSPSQQSQTIELHVEDEDESGDTMEDYSEEEDDSDADPVTTEDEDDSEDDGDDEDGDDDDPGYSEESDGDQDQMEIDLLPQV